MAKDPPATRDRILHAAYALFYREGFARVSVDAIAKAAGVTAEVVRLRVFWGGTMEQIAEILRVSKASVERWGWPGSSPRPAWRTRQSCRGRS